MRKERAGEILKDLRRDDWEARRDGRIARLPGPVRDVAERLAQEPWWSIGIRNLHESAAHDLDALDTADREALFEASLPGLAVHLERMWLDGRRLPYRTGEIRRAFRAPNLPAVSLRARRGRLLQLFAPIQQYEPGDPAWIARWAGHIAVYGIGDSLGTFLAAVLDGGGAVADEVHDILVASANGEDEIGVPGRHVTRAFLTSGREDGWAFTERYLLAAQREEGLRQSILEAVDEADPRAFRRMLRLILDNGLTRFSSTVRAIDTWFGFEWGAPSGRALDDTLARALRFLDDEEMRDAALRSGAAEDAFLALWAIAFEDGPAAVEPAVALLADPAAERRYAGVHLLAELGLDTAHRALAPALEDDDLRVVGRALDAHVAIVDPSASAPDAFERLERLLGRVPPKGVELEPIIWPWTGRRLELHAVGTALTAHLGDRPIDAIVRHLSVLPPDARLVVARRLAGEASPGPAVRQALVRLAGDAAVVVRGVVLEAVKKLEVDDDEALELEALLGRKASDLRRAVVRILLNRSDDGVLASADRLLAARDGPRRLGGLEILRRLVETGRAEGPSRERAAAYRDARPALDADERTQLDAILGSGPAEAATGAPAAGDAPADDGLPAVPTLADGLGLLQTRDVTPPVAPRSRDVRPVTEAALAGLRELDRLVHEQRDAPVTVRLQWREEAVPLSEVMWGFPVPEGGMLLEPLAAAGDPETTATIDRHVAVAAEAMPLREILEAWWAERGSEARDADGLELVRAMLVPHVQLFGSTPMPALWAAGFRAILGPLAEPDLRYRVAVAGFLDWLVALHPPDGLATFALDTLETTLAALPDGSVANARGVGGFGWDPGWRDNGSPWLQPLVVVRRLRVLRPDAFGQADSRRLHGLERWADEVEAPPNTDAGPGIGPESSWVHRERPPFEYVVASFVAGAASEADLIDQLVGPRSGPYGFGDLGTYSRRTPPKPVTNKPPIIEIIDRVRRRVVDVELRRGEAPTAASGAALVLRHSGGLDVLARTTRALGKEPFVRGWSYDGFSRQVVFSRLIRATFPGASDTPAAFGERMRAEGVGERRLVELGCFVPQWAAHVEAAVGWPGLASAIWWFHAHTKDQSWTVEAEVRQAWAAEIADRTPLDTADLVDGAVDGGWFGRVYEELGAERWRVLDAAAKYCSTAGGHKRAQLFADAMRGALSAEELEGRIGEKRHQDALRGLGLVPLPGEPARDEAVLARYRVMQEFVRSSRQFGSSRQASEKRAAQIGLENLARTAGYADPIRLGWAMEARGVADLADGPLRVTIGDVEVALAIDDRGEAHVTVRRGGEVVKALPEAAKRDKGVAALRGRATELRRGASRTRASLEMAMIRGDAFTGAELRELCRHPLLAPLVMRLVLVGSDSAGYPVASGLAVRDARGAEHPVGASEVLRLAHPVDLLERGGWSEWQADCFRREVVQPFKQVFRELYVPTATELAAPLFTRRYAGHQVQPRRALALLGGRGWVAHAGEGTRKVFHDLRLAASLAFMEPFHTPAEIEELTLEAVVFARQGSWEPVPLGDVPPRIFSEVMRDVDLVVAVAHAGGVDPEASASSVELRAALVVETARALGLGNVRVDSPRVIVEGSLGEYSVHLGSAGVQRRPGGALLIVPVHGQHRGRLFLPFVDDDPKTAEVVSKVLLLARDSEIRDPSILDQIRG